MSLNTVKPARCMASTAALGLYLAVQMVGSLNDGPKADVVRRRNLFRRLRIVMGVLVPSESLSPKFVESLKSWPAVWERGDYKAARYQMVQLVRKLRKYRDDWTDDSDYIGVLGPTHDAPSPLVAAVAG